MYLKKGTIMPINFQGQINKKEYMKALEINLSQIKWLKWVSGLILGIVIFSAVVTIWLNPSMVKTLFPSIVFPLILLTFPWWIIYLQAASYNQKGNIYHTPINGFTNETGIAINGQETKSFILWKAFTHYKHNHSMVLLYQGKSCFNIFTSNLFKNDEDWIKFLDEISVNIEKIKKQPF
jgi:hypothetical protein